MSRYLARHVGKRDREQWYQDEAEKALRPARELLEKYGIPYVAHVEKGDTAGATVAKAKDLRCDCILISTARKDSLNRLLAASVTNRILALTDIPVEVVVGQDVSNLESIGIPAGVGLGIAGLIMLVLD
jgi:nucleotide-binding universal stress UspA family protein